MVKRRVLSGFITSGASGIEYKEGGSVRKKRNSPFERTKASRITGFRNASKSGNNHLIKASEINKNKPDAIVQTRTAVRPASSGQIGRPRGV